MDAAETAAKSVAHSLRGAFAALLVVSLSSQACSPAQPKTTDAPTPTPDGTPPSLVALCQCDGRYGAQSPKLDPTRLPIDVSLRDNQTCPASGCQACFDCFAWQLFVTLNWPSNTKGEPLHTAPFGAPGDTRPTVWERYADADQLFGPAPPPPWEQRDGNHTTSKPLARIHKIKRSQQADHRWLTDRDGAVVHYEIRVNEDVYRYVTTNGLYHQRGLVKALQSGAGVSLPAGPGAHGPHGAIEVKAAWRKVPAGEQARFEKTHKLATVKLPNETTPQLVALIGMHIAKKTPNSPQWVWTTFEHRHNAPDLGHEHEGGPYHFYDRALPKDWAPNHLSPPDGYAKPPTPYNRPVQLTRITPIDQKTTSPINDAMRALIVASRPDSIWQYYQLVGVQWASEPEFSHNAGQSLPLGKPQPAALANITMESYMQAPGQGGGAEDGRSSCIGCHAKAAITPTFDAAIVPDGKPLYGWTDYSTLFFRAQRHKLALESR